MPLQNRREKIKVNGLLSSKFLKFRRVKLRTRESLVNTSKMHQTDKRITSFQIFPKYVIIFSRKDSGKFSISKF